MAIDVLRQAQGNNLSDTLSTSIGSTDTTIPVNTISIWSANGGKVIIDRGLSTQEIVYCSGVSGSSLVVQAGGRGLEGTTAQGHNVGAAVESVPTAKDWNDLVTSVENVLVKSTGLLDTTKVATPSSVSDFATNFANFIKSGLTAPTSASLSTTITAGTIFYSGVEISVASDGGHTYTASNDCYVDVSNAGAYTYNTVANGASAPALTANSIRIAKVVTSGTAVTSVTQSGVDSLGNIIYPNNPSISPTHAMITFEQITTPANPSNGYSKTYFKSDGNLYSLNSSGTETQIGNSTDGWFSDSHTWTYVSASSFKISGVDLTAVFTKGTRLKFTQTTVKYAVVVSSSFSTDTTVTIAVNTDYTIANASITSPFYSYAANPQGYPTWFNYSLTFGGFSANPTSVVAKFSVIGQQCFLKVSMPNSGTSNSTSFTITAPITSASDSGDQSLFGTGVIDNSTNIAHTGPAVLPANSATITLYTSENFGTWTSSGSKRLTYLQGFYPF